MNTKFCAYCGKKIDGALEFGNFDRDSGTSIYHLRYKCSSVDEHLMYTSLHDNYYERDNVSGNIVKYCANGTEMTR